MASLSSFTTDGRLSSDDWDNQMLYFLGKGYRVIAHDRRGHGRSSQVNAGHDMDHYAADVAAVVDHLDLRNAIHVGHSTGGGEATRYTARHGKERVFEARSDRRSHADHGKKPPPILAAFLSRFSTAPGWRSPRTDRSFTSTSQAARSMDSTAMALKRRMRRSRIGGDRA